MSSPSSKSEWLHRTVRAGPAQFAWISRGPSGGAPRRLDGYATCSSDWQSHEAITAFGEPESPARGTYDSGRAMILPETLKENP
jgi:hypothetical protein